MSVFPDAWLNELLSKSDIVSIASEYTLLKPKGRRLWGCCPFHSEKTPSFSVTPENQLYYCFGCHAGGSVVQFVMETEKLTYIEAIKYLAQRAGMELPENVDDDRLRNERALKERLYAACKEAALFYHAKLMGPEGKAAQAYLIRRRVDSATVKKFGLGYAPDGWDNLTAHLTAKGYTNEELIAAGLALPGRKDGRCYDAFRNRIIFPIISTMKRVIGFGARAMGDEKPKYLNTGDTPIFNKRNNLYALNMQRGKHISDLIMVEGYMDVISLYKGGVDNAVASLGTALTQQQARLIKRYVPHVYISYDGDSAGQNATLRGMEILAKEGLDVRVLVIPDDMDPDDYINRNGREAYLALKDGALTLNAFKLDNLMAALDMNTADGREEYAKKACAFLATLQPVEQERYAPLVARRTGLSQGAILRQCGVDAGIAADSIGNNRNTKQKSRKITEAANRAEVTLLCCMMHSSQALITALELMAEYGVAFGNDELTAFTEKLLAAYSLGEKPDMRLLMSECEPAAAEVLAAAMDKADAVTEPVAMAEDCVRTLARERLYERKNELAQMLSSGDENAKREYMEIERKLTSLK